MDDLSGQSIRGYVLRQQIGTGGFAAVYRADQPVVEREVAIKIILPRFANNPDFVRRFEDEAQLIARLEHLHIVPLYDFWREPGNAYLVMRWLRGGSLYDSLQQDGPWDLPAATRLVEQVASALAAAHRQGIVHQDIAPTNILLDEERNAFLADFGIARDIVRRTDTEQTTYGSPAYIAPERIRQEPSTPQTDIYSLGLILYELLTGKAAFDGPSNTAVIFHQLADPVPPLQLQRPDLPDTFNAIILRATAKDPAERYPDAVALAQDFREAAAWGAGMSALYRQGIAGDKPPDGDTGAPSTIELAEGTIPLDERFTVPNPYKGLRAFDMADSADFFGRTALVDDLLARMGDRHDARRFLAVVGPSGSGKSSAVKAGLLPRLREGALPGSETWFIARMTPGTDPLAELEAALRGVSFAEPDALDKLDLRAGDRVLYETVQRIMPGEEADLVLVIDQFEEVFTQVADEAARVHFLRSLTTAVTEPNSRLWVIITLRADYYDRPLVYGGFSELVRERTVVVLPLTPAELGEAITGPARRVGLAVEPELVPAMVADVSAQPGALPLLQYALTELFERREDDMLTLAAYQGSGGVSGALAARAEELFNELDATGQTLSRQLFLRLVAPGEGAADTRRRARWAEVMALGGEEGNKDGRDAMRAVLDRFGEARLLTFDRDPDTREPTVEIAHEALIRGWARLRGWLDENRDNLRLRRRLSAAAAEWHNAGRESGFLASGARLAGFEGLVESGALALTAEERAYVAAGVAQRQRARRRVQAFIAALIALTALALGLAAFARDRQTQAEDARAAAEDERDRADTQASIARSRELAVTALTNLNRLDLALLLSLAALDSADTLEARGSLLTALETAPHLAAILHNHAAPVRAVAPDPDGATFATAAQDGAIIVWDAATRRPAQVVAVADGWANALAFNPDGTTLAAGLSDGSLALWDAATGERRGVELASHPDTVWDVAFSPDGTVLASAGADDTVRLWDITGDNPTGEPLAVLEGHADAVYSVAFSPDGSLLASGGGDDVILLWDMSGDDPPDEPLAVLEGHTYWVRDVAFSPGGELLASASTDGTVILWDAATATLLGAPLTGHEKEVRAVAFSPDGTRLVSAGADGSLLVWDTLTGLAALPPLAGHSAAIWDAAFSADGRTIISGGVDAEVRLWDVTAAHGWQRALPGHDEAVLALAYHPDGTVLASGGGDPAGGGADHAVYLWDTQDGAPLGMLAGHTDSVSALAYTPDGSVLVSASYDGTVRRWEADSGAELDTLVGHTAPILALAASPDGRVIASGDDSGAIWLWDAATGEPLGDPLNAPDSVMSLAFAPDGSVLAAGSRDGRTTRWDVATGDPVGEPLAGHTDAVTALAYSPDGSLLASASRDFTIRLWDAATGAPARPPLEAHTDWVMALAFSPDGRWLASGGYDQVVILWDTARGQPIGGPLAGHTDLVSSVRFAPDGRAVASADWDGTILLWDVDLNTWQSAACAIAHRELTAEEAARYFPDLAVPPVLCGAGM